MILNFLWANLLFHSLEWERSAFCFSQVKMPNAKRNFFYFKSKKRFCLTFLCRYLHLIGFLIPQNTRLKKFWGETFGSIWLYYFFCLTVEVILSFPTSLIVFSHIAPLFRAGIHLFRLYMWWSA